MKRKAIHIVWILALMVAVTLTMGGQSNPSSQMTVQCQEMMSQHHEMMTRMQAMDSKLNDLLVEMNRAKGNAKIDAMAKVINEMADQRKQMHQSMMQMHHGSMKCPMMGTPDAAPKN